MHFHQPVLKFGFGCFFGLKAQNPFFIFEFVTFYWHKVFLFSLVSKCYVYRPKKESMLGALQKTKEHLNVQKSQMMMNAESKFN